MRAPRVKPARTDAFTLSANALRLFAQFPHKREVREQFRLHEIARHDPFFTSEQFMSMRDVRICREHVVDLGYSNISLRPLSEDPIWLEATRYLQLKEGGQVSASQPQPPGPERVAVDKAHLNLDIVKEMIARGSHAGAYQPAAATTPSRPAADRRSLSEVRAESEPYSSADRKSRKRRCVFVRVCFPLL